LIRLISNSYEISRDQYLLRQLPRTFAETRLSNSGRESDKLLPRRFVRCSRAQSGRIGQSVRTYAAMSIFSARNRSAAHPHDLTGQRFF
jgi:hypothetical protein